jgi:peptide deformylase
MAILPLVIAPDPRLKIISEPVEKVDDELRKLMDDMVETMYFEKGIGLAAVQVGVHKRVLVMDVGKGSERYPDTQGESEIMHLVNPEILEASKEENVYKEGCLSFPDQFVDVTRPKTAKIKFLDYFGKEQIIEADELLATCVQHEIDHLNGITLVDHASPLKRDMILRKLTKMKKAGAFDHHHDHVHGEHCNHG